MSNTSSEAFQCCYTECQHAGFSWNSTQKWKLLIYVVIIQGKNGHALKQIQLVQQQLNALLLINYSDNKEGPHSSSKKHKNEVFKVCTVYACLVARCICLLWFHTVKTHVAYTLWSIFLILMFDFWMITHTCLCTIKHNIK